MFLPPVTARPSPVSFPWTSSPPQGGRISAAVFFPQAPPPPDETGNWPGNLACAQHHPPETEEDRPAPRPLEGETPRPVCNPRPAYTSSTHGVTVDLRMHTLDSGPVPWSSRRRQSLFSRAPPNLHGWVVVVGMSDGSTGWASWLIQLAGALVGATICLSLVMVFIFPSVSGD